MSTFFLKLVQLLLLILGQFPQACNPTNGILVKIKDSTIRVKNQRKSVLAVSDQMQNEFDVDLDELHEDLDANKALDRGHWNRRMEALVSRWQILGHENVENRKMQLVRMGDGQQKFAVSFEGNKKMLDEFAKVDRNDINSLKDLAKKLDQIYLKTSVQRQIELKDKDTKIRPHEFFVTDGKQIYSIKVGRTRGDSELPKDLKKLKIKRKRGNLYVRGWNAKMLREDLAPAFEQRRFFGLFKGKRSKTRVEEAHALINNALRQQSRRYAMPNGVSESNFGYHMRSTGEVEELKHVNEEEQRSVNSMPYKKPGVIVEEFVRNGWINKTKKWESPWLKAEVAMHEARKARAESGQAGSRKGLYIKREEDRGRGRGMGRVPRVPGAIRLDNEWKKRRRSGWRKTWANVRTRVGKWMRGGGGFG